MTGGQEVGIKESVRRRGSVMLSNEEMVRRIREEVARALGIANMRRHYLVEYVEKRMLANGMARVPPSAVEDEIKRMISEDGDGGDDGGRTDTAGAANAAADMIRAEATVGCPCCTGGRIPAAWEEIARGNDAAAVPRPVPRTRLPLHIGDGMDRPAAHAVYCLLDAWESEYGLAAVPTRGDLIQEVCERGGYEWDVVAEAVRLLAEWRVISCRDDKVEVVAPRGRLK